MINPRALFIIPLTLLVVYSFFGFHAVGVVALIIIIIQVLP